MVLILLLLAWAQAADQPSTQPASRPATAAALISLVNRTDGYAIDYPPTLSEKIEPPERHIKTKLVELDESRRDRFHETIIIQRIEAAEPLALDDVLHPFIEGLKREGQELVRIEEDRLGGQPAKRLITRWRVKGVPLVSSYTLTMRGAELYTFVVAAAERRAVDFMQTAAGIQDSFRFVEKAGDSPD